MFSEPLRTVVIIGSLAAVGGIYLAHKAPVASDSRPSVQAAEVEMPIRASQGYGQVELRADAGGQYHANVDVEGIRIPMLVDTGATFLALTFDDAQRLGLTPASADYTVDVMTANGHAKAAKTTLREVRLGTLLVSGVPALILPRDTHGMSLLGMSFLKKLGGFQIASGTLVLKP